MRNQDTAPIRALLAAVGLAAVTLVSCSTPSSSSSGGTAPASSPAGSAPASTAPASSASGTAACPTGWRTGSVTVTRQVSVPPVPVVTAIRTATHPECRFDRVVIDIGGASPGYTVRFVQHVVGDASGKLLSMPGSTYLEIRLRPAQGHSDSGATTVPGSRTLSFPMLKGFRVAGDFEGVLTIALGLAGGRQYRIGSLPNRIYLDVAW